METQNITPNEPSEDKTVSASAKSKFGIFGLIIGIPGFAISVSTAFLIYFIAMAGGGLDIMMTRTQYQAIIIFLYCGLFLGITGRILGAVSLSRRENKIAGIISILFGLPTLCIFSVAIYFRVLF